MSGIQELLQVMQRLREPKKGCPWDLQQSHESLRPYFVEEVHEFLEALETLGPQDPKTWEELGDVLFQVVFHAQLLSEQKRTDFDGIAGHMARKLRERHPHVFDPAHPGFQDAQSVNQAWEGLKRKKSKENSTRLGSLESIPKALPALQRSSRLGEKAASFAFDWPDAPSALQKVSEEWNELQAALKNESEEAQQDEWGDLVFALAQYARKRRWDPELLLARCNQKFMARFGRMEELATERGVEWEAQDLDGLERLWQASKGVEKSKKL